MSALKRFLAGCTMGFIVSAALFALLLLAGDFTVTKYVQTVAGITLGCGLAFLLFLT